MKIKALKRKKKLHQERLSKRERLLFTSTTRSVHFALFSLFKEKFSVVFKGKKNVFESLPPMTAKPFQLFSQAKPIPSTVQSTDF